MLECIRYKVLLRKSIIVIIIVLFVYILLLRGWVRTVEISKQELNTIFENIDSLSYPQSFSNFYMPHELDINGEKYWVSYDENIKSYNIYISSPGKQSLFFSICDKNDFQLEFSLNEVVSSEEDFKKKIKAEYGAFDNLYNLFSNDISTEQGKAYLSPVSRVRSEIYSFTAEKNVSGIFSTEKYIVGFSCTSKEGDLDLFFDFLDYLATDKQSGDGSVIDTLIP